QDKTIDFVQKDRDAGQDHRAQDQDRRQRGPFDVLTPFLPEQRFHGAPPVLFARKPLSPCRPTWAIRASSRLIGSSSTLSAPSSSRSRSVRPLRFATSSTRRFSLRVARRRPGMLGSLRSDSQGKRATSLCTRS